MKADTLCTAKTFQRFGDLYDDVFVGVCYVVEVEIAMWHSAFFHKIKKKKKQDDTHIHFRTTSMMTVKGIWR